MAPVSSEADAQRRLPWAQGTTVGPGASRGQRCKGASAAPGLGSWNLRSLPDTTGESPLAQA